MREDVRRVAWCRSPRGPRARRRPGWTLGWVVAFLVVLVVAGFVAGMLLGSVGRAREAARRVTCADRLKQIGQALLLYSNDNQGHPPRTTYRPGAPVTYGTGAAAPDPFGPGGPDANDVTANLFLLLRTQHLGAHALVCPSADQQPDPLPPAGRSNFGDWRWNLSYSLQNPYHDPFGPAGEAPDKDVAVAADLNPGKGHMWDVTAVTPGMTGEAVRKGNSANHKGVGQNVLYADGHVDWTTTPLAGKKGDNVYTAIGDGKQLIDAPPADAGDSVLLPVRR